MKIYKGNILSCDQENHVYNYLIENNGIITYVGNTLLEKYEQERIIDLKMCTYNGYYTSFDEEKRGNLEIDKIADMVILSKNPYTMNKEYLHTLKVEQLLLQGEVYKPIHKNPIAHIEKGMFSKK